MSLFFPLAVTCPSCAQPVVFEASASVNADRRPDIRDEILAGTFQQEACPHCQTTFRLEPELNYMDLARNQWLAVFPVEKLAAWEELEAMARTAFAEAYGEDASEMAREIGAELHPRLVFGWAAFREKIAAHEAGLDDVTLELMKMGLIHGLENAPLAFGTALRFIEAAGEELSIAWIDSRTEAVRETLLVPRSFYEQIAADPAAWQTLRTEVSAGYFVDLLRLIAATEPSA